MRVKWFFRRNRCCCCRCCRYSSRCNMQTHASSDVYTVYSVQHFANVPMHIHYGPGYTQHNVLESMDASLQTMADTAERMHSNCGQHTSCCSC